MADAQVLGGPLEEHQRPHVAEGAVDDAFAAQLLHVFLPVDEARQDADVRADGEVVGLRRAQASLVRGHVGEPARGQVVEDHRCEGELPWPWPPPLLHAHVAELVRLARRQLDAHLRELHGGGRAGR